MTTATMTFLKKETKSNISVPWDSTIYYRMDRYPTYLKEFRKSIATELRFFRDAAVPEDHLTKTTGDFFSWLDLPLKTIDFVS